LRGFAEANAGGVEERDKGFQVDWEEREESVKIFFRQESFACGTIFQESDLRQGLEKFSVSVLMNETKRRFVSPWE
jgi:hypothetical protein